MLDRRNDGVFRPIVVRYSNENGRPFGHRTQNRPHEKLFVANEDRSAFMADLERSGAVEIQRNAVGSSGLPHGHRQRNALLKLAGCCIATNDDDVFVGGPSGDRNISSDEERLSLFLHEAQLWTPKQIGGAVPTMHGCFRENDNARLRRESGALDELRITIRAERIGKVYPCTPKLSVDALPARKRPRRGVGETGNAE